MVICSNCKKFPSVIELRYSREFLCRRCFSRLFEKRVRKTIRVNHLLNQNDKVAVGLSGGKDSVTLLKILHKLSKRAPKSKLIAISVDEGIHGYREKTLKIAKKICKELKVEHYVYTFKKEIGMTLDQMMKKSVAKRSPPACSFCGVFRRKILNEAARELKANKLATGHNLDDEIQVTLMNFIRGDFDRIARMGPEVGIIKDKKFIPRIKPLRECPEREVAIYAILNGFKADGLQCPYAGEALRTTIRDVINEIEEKHPGSKFQMLKTTDRLIEILREQYKTDKKINECKNCGELTSRELCKACGIMKELNLT